ncbi:hypothetical protein Tco_0146810 [Tanacetum coccineum]
MLHILMMLYPNLLLILKYKIKMGLMMIAVFRIMVLLIKQFWRSAEASTDDNGEVKINATIDGHSLSITEGSLRRHLKLADQDGITSIPNSEIFEQLVHTHGISHRFR